MTKKPAHKSSAVDTLKQVRYIVVHTAADPREDGAYDTTMADIRVWHLARGWQEAGYHFLVRRNGQVETGRAETKVGAHTLGLNHCSIGVCLSGHGDKQPMTEAQERSLIRVLVGLARKYQVPPERIIGHREVNLLVDRKQIPSIYRTSKSCPGHRVSMATIRSRVRQALKEPNLEPT